MEPVMQTRFTMTDGNCQQACIAAILEIPLSDVPNYCGPNWLREYNKWLFKKFGIAMITLDADCDFWETLWGTGQYYHVIGGKSPRLPCHHS